MSAHGAILVVDDAPENLEVLTQILTADGYQVLPANSGEIALAAVAARPPDLVLLDIRMPDLDGFEVCQRLKADPSSRDIPIMFISAFGDSAERQRGFELGAVDFVSKPFQPEELGARVRTHIDLRHAQLKLQDALAAAERFREALDHTPAYIYMKDTRSRYIYGNRATQELFGCSAAELTGKRDRDFFPPETVERLRDVDARVLGGARTSEEIDVPDSAAGSRVYWEVKTPIFAANGSDTVWGILGISTDITERKEAEETLRLSLSEKEGLLKEVHHRVKNNLQVINSLLRLETSRSGVPDTQRVLKEMQGRIMSMALLHETLYRSGRFGQVDLSIYLRQLAQQMFRANSTPGAARLETDLSPVRVTIDQAIPCGLILNELLTNSLKHAFAEGQGGEVRVTLRQDADDVVHLAVTDSGAGLPKDFDARRGKSLGLQLVTDLAKQLGGRLEVGPGPGAGFSVFFTPTAQSLRPVGAKPDQ